VRKGFSFFSESRFCFCSDISLFLLRLSSQFTHFSRANFLSTLTLAPDIFRSSSMLKNIVWSDPSREHDLPPGWRAHTVSSERGSKVLQFDMLVMPQQPANALV
jgi:hypothetical protein